jgi:hypothetical protein
MGRMGWEGFMRIEREQLRQRREGKLRRALGVPLAGETAEQLDRIGERDRARADQGLVPIMDKGGTITHEHIDDLTMLDMRFRTAAERVTVEWLKERVERSRKGKGAPPIPEHLDWASENPA